MGADDKTGSLGRFKSYALKDFFPLYQHFPHTELFMGEEFIPQ